MKGDKEGRNSRREDEILNKKMWEYKKWEVIIRGKHDHRPKKTSRPTKPKSINRKTRGFDFGKFQIENFQKTFKC